MAKETNSIQTMDYVQGHELEEKLIDACFQKDVASIQLLLEQGADPNYLTSREGDRVFPFEDQYLSTPLDIISLLDHKFRQDDPLITQAATLLLQYGANVNGANIYSTPLHHAADFYLPGLIKVLIQYGADINAPDELGYTPLHIISGGYGGFDPQMLPLLLEYGIDIHAQSHTGDTAAHIICEYNKEAGGLYEGLEILKTLVSLGAKVDIPNEQGTTVLMMAQNRQDIKEAIINGIIEGVSTSDQKNDLIQQVMQTAVKFGIDDISELSKSENADIKIKIFDEVIEQYLISAYPNHILEYQLNQACIDLDLNKIEALLKQGADPNYFSSADYDGTQLAPLNVIATHPFNSFSESYEVLNLLLSYDANPNSIDLEGNTALHSYTKHAYGWGCDSDFISLLLDYSADLNMQNDKGDTPAHNLISVLSNEHNSVFGFECASEILTQLTQAGADLTIKNAQNESVQELSENCARCQEAIVLGMITMEEKSYSVELKDLFSFESIDPINDTVLDQDNSLITTNDNPPLNLSSLEVLQTNDILDFDADTVIDMLSDQDEVSNDLFVFDAISHESNESISSETTQTEAEQSPSAQGYFCYLVPDMVAQLTGICEQPV